MDLSTLEHGPAGFALDYDRDDAVLDLGTLSPQVRQQVLDRLVSKDLSAWVDTLAWVGNCVRPVRLGGTSDQIDPTTGEMLSSFSCANQPLGAVHVQCGNRRASECSSCSRPYAADVIHLIPRCRALELALLALIAASYRSLGRPTPVGAAW